MSSYRKVRPAREVGRSIATERNYHLLHDGWYWIEPSRPMSTKGAWQLRGFNLIEEIEVGLRQRWPLSYGLMEIWSENSLPLLCAILILDVAAEYAADQTFGLVIHCYDPDEDKYHYDHIELPVSRAREIYNAYEDAALSVGCRFKEAELAWMMTRNQERQYMLPNLSFFREEDREVAEALNRRQSHRDEVCVAVYG